MAARLSAGHIRDIHLLCKPCLSYILTDACRWFLIYYTHQCSLKYFFEYCRNSLLLSLLPAPLYLNSPLLTGMLTLLKINKNILGQNKTNKVLLGTENAFNLLTNPLLNLSHVLCVLNLPFQQKEAFCIWNTVFYLFVVSQAAYQRSQAYFCTADEI